jgi:hypothetical protein
MKDYIRSLLLKYIRKGMVCQIDGEEGCGAVDVLFLAGGQVIDHGHGETFGDKPVHKVGADESGASSNQNSSVSQVELTPSVGLYLS